MDDTDDDTLSTVSTGTSSDITLTQEAEEEVDTGSVLETFVDELFEKRSKTREAAFKGLISALKSNVLTEFVEDKYETLLHRCITSVKKGAGTEIALASQTIGLIALTCGAGDVAYQIVSEASPHLIKIAKLGSDSKARIAALEALALVCFIGCSDYEAAEGVMDVLWQISTHKGNFHASQTLGTNTPLAEVRAAALLAWSFLLTTIPSSRIIGSLMPQCLSMLSSLLDAKEQAVRLSAGEAIALLFETRNFFDSKSTGRDEDSSGELATTLSRKVIELKEAEIIEQIKALATEAGGKGQSNKKAQRSSFKDVLAMVEGRYVMTTSIKLRQGDLFATESWVQMIQLKFITGVLAEGLQRHLQENTLLHEIFDFVPRQEKRPTLTTKQKRLYMSPNSILNKERTQKMNWRRSQAYAGQVGHFNIAEADSD